MKNKYSVARVLIHHFTFYKILSEEIIFTIYLSEVKVAYHMLLKVPQYSGGNLLQKPSVERLIAMSPYDVQMIARQRL